MRHRAEGPDNVPIIRVGVRLPLLLTAIAASFAQQTLAQTYPSSLIRIIVPYAAGGVTDSLARVVGAQVADAVGQPVVIENRPGASSMLGMQACANAKPDGYTICIAVADSLSYNPQLFASLPYDPENSFAPVMRLALTKQLVGRLRQGAIQQLQRNGRVRESQSGQAQLGNVGSCNAARPLSSLGLHAGRR